MKKRIRKRRPKRSSRDLPRRDRALSKRVRELYRPGEKDNEDDWSADLDAVPMTPGRGLPGHRVPGRAEAETAGAAAEPSAESQSGLVVMLASGACHVEVDGTIYECVLPSRLARSQQFAVAVGDRVAFRPHGDGHRVESVLPRRTVLSRPDPQNPRLERVLAANVDTVVQVSAVRSPPLQPALIDRYLIAIERGGARPVLCLNKIDLTGADELARELSKLDVYREMGVAVIACSARSGAGIGALRVVLAGCTAAFVGHSGVGKSSLANALSPDLELATGEISRRHARGRHTTTRSSLHRLAGGIRLIDTPGIRELGLWQMTPQELRLGFAEFDEPAAGCRFNDCSHVHEPECAVCAAVDEGRIAAARYATYVRILASLDDENA